MYLMLAKLHAKWSPKAQPAAPVASSSI